MASQYAGLGDQSRGLLRDGIRSAAREGARGEGAVREAGLRGGRVARRAGARRADAADRRRWRRGWRGRRASRRTRLTFAVAPTASLAGGVQIVARIIETGLHKMETLGFDVTPRRQRDRHRADAAGGEERHAGDRPHQRLRAVRRAGPLHGARGRREAGGPGANGCRPRRRTTTARRSTTSSSATTTTSIRSIRCCSARPRCG